VTPVGLRCAHLDNPLGVAPDRVRFSWRLEDSGRDTRQDGYHVQVFPNDRLRLSEETVCWDSGRIASVDSADVPYGGSPLARGGRYWWRVRVWDGAGVASPWSEPATFEVELDPALGWPACWIGLGPLRESFTPPAEIVVRLGSWMTMVGHR
jgi:alpha-L-rhamnosidase